MPTNEKQEVEKALGGLALENVRLDWPQFKTDYGIHHDKPVEDAADRDFFSWQHFRGQHQPQSCLLDEQGHVRGLIIKNTKLKKLRLPALPALEYLCICENRALEDIELEGTAYPLLQHLDWSNNALKRLTLQAEMPLLRYLSLRGNQLKRFEIDEQQEGLAALEELDLSYNQIKNWNAFVLDKMPALAYLFLYQNPLNESVTVYREDNEDENYLRSLQVLLTQWKIEKPIKNDTYKVLVVGDGKAGKSCMVERLVHNSFCGEWDSTHGISVEQFEDKDGRYNFPYKLSLWDFGGQDIYHHTHRMFLQANTTYILLWNSETEYQDKIIQRIGNKEYTWDNKKLPYWLDYIRYLGQGSPVVVAQTWSRPEIHDQKMHPNESKLLETYQKAFPYISKFLDLDAKEEDTIESGYEFFLQEVGRAIYSLGRKEYLPAYWFAVREQLEGMTPREVASDQTAFMSSAPNTLELDEFLKMMPPEATDPMKLLNNWLVPTGVVFYKEGLFDNKIILNQAWAIRAVYALYDRSEAGYFFDLKEKKGHFNGALLNQCWHTYTAAERQWFLDFMLKAELCFEITPEGWNTPWEERQFVAVEMLPNDRANSLGNQERNWKREKTALCQVRYRYPFLHTGIIQSFIVRTHHFAEVEDIYKQGLIVWVNDQPVIIEAQPSAEGHQGDILVTLPTAAAEVLHRIRKEFAGIHQSRDYKEAIRPADGEWVLWEVLESKCQEDKLATADGGNTVFSDPYRVFLPDEKRREVQALSETKNQRSSMPTKTYPRESESIISVPMKNDLSQGKGWYIEPNEKIKLLFTAATPTDAGKLNTGKESRFKDLIKMFDEQQRIDFKEEHGLNVEKFRRHYFSQDPHVIHFAGHGEIEGLVLEEDNLDADVLVNLVSLLKKTRIVVLNACYTLPLAKELAKYVPFVIGTQGVIPDDTAIAFANDFYVGLAAGKTVEDSFLFGINGIESKRLPGADIPILVVGEPYFND